MPFKKPKIKRSNPGVIKALKKNVKKSGLVEVGIIASEKHEGDELTVAEVGFYNEFGTTKIPERSFIRSTVKNKTKELKALSSKLLKSIVNGKMTTTDGLGIIGEKMSDEIQRAMVKLRTPPNKPATIRRKGSSNPLIDTEQLKSAITYEVKNA